MRQLNVTSGAYCIASFLVFQYDRYKIIIYFCDFNILSSIFSNVREILHIYCLVNLLRAYLNQPA